MAHADRIGLPALDRDHPEQDQHLLDFKDAVRARLMLFNDVSHYAGYSSSPKASLSKWWDVEDKGPSGDADRAR